MIGWKRYHPGDLLCERCQLELDERVIGHWITTATNPHSQFTDDPGP
jgi:hypothetical protein